MCYEMLKEPKRLVYAYDELQNLRTQSLPSPEAIFGKYENGKPRVKFNISEEGKPQQDIILEKCYRNSRPALVTAHALGFGIYRKPESTNESGLVQMFEQDTLWKDIGYEIAEGQLEDGKHVVLQRTSQSSPEFLEKHSNIDDLIIFKSFSSKEEQDLWVAEQIRYNLSQDELRPDDIIVINPDPVTTKKQLHLLENHYINLEFYLIQQGLTQHQMCFLRMIMIQLHLLVSIGLKEMKLLWCMWLIRNHVINHYLIWRKSGISYLPL